MTVTILSQYDKELSAAEAKAACGAAAAAAFVQFNGRNPTVREALNLAQARSLWDQSVGMHGIDAEADLIKALGGSPTVQKGVPDWARVRAEVEAGHPVIIDTADHYFIANGYDPQTDRFNLGASGTAIGGGSEWMSPGQMATFSRLDTTPRGAIYVGTQSDGEGTAVQPSDWTGVAPITPAQGGAIVQANGGRIVGNKPVENATHRVINGAAEVKDEFGLWVPDPTPTYRVDYANGKYLIVTPTRGPDGEPDGNQEVHGGTALKPASTAGSTAWHWQTQTDGSKVALHTDGTPVRDANGEIVVSARAGSTETAAQADQRAAAADASRAAAEHSRALTAQIGKPPPQSPETIAHIQAQTDLERERLEVERQKLLPKQQLLLQQAQDTIAFIQKGIAAGTTSVEDGNRQMAAVHTYVDAGMRGTTPFDEYKLAQEQEEKRAATAAGLINERVRATTTLADSLFGTYQRQTANNTEASSFDPLIAAQGTMALSPDVAASSRLSSALLGPLSAQNAPATPDPSILPPEAQAWFANRDKALVTPDEYNPDQMAVQAA